MTTVSIDEFQRDLIGYLRRVEAGETLLVARADEVVAEIRPVDHAENGKQLRPVGLAAGEFSVPDDFDAPLPDDILRAFEGQ